VKAYLSTLNDREKWMLIGTAVCLFLYVYYLFLYSPLSQQVNQKSTQLVEKTATLEWMNKIRQQRPRYTTKKRFDYKISLSVTTNWLRRYSADF